MLAENIAAWERLPGEATPDPHREPPGRGPDRERARRERAPATIGRVVQKSLAEGFGLTVAEAMWKRRPVVGSKVGGIQDQIVDGRSGVLVDPTDTVGVGRRSRR